MKPSIHFKEGSKKAQAFFSILPLDWQEGIVPYWNQYRHSSEVYLIEEEGEIIGGGILFTQVTPDMMANASLAQKYFDKAYVYLGFIWISEDKRGMGLGQFWLKKVFENNPNITFWLTIEDPQLESFYKKWGFAISEKIENQGSPEWIMLRRPTMNITIES